MEALILTTRTINPPWDESGKNLVLNIARNIKSMDIALLSSNKNFEIGKNIKKFYIGKDKKFSHSMPFSQKFLLMTKLLMGKKFEIYHLFFTPKENTINILKKITKNKKSIQTITSIHNLKHFNKNIKEVLFADKIVVISDYTREILKKNDLESIRIYPGIDLKRFSPSNDTDLRNKLGLKQEKIILYPGDFNVLKKTESVGYLLGIIKETLGKSENTKFILACRIRSREDFKVRNYFIKKLKELNLDKKVIILGTLFDLKDLLNLSDVVIFPHKKEMKAKLELPLALIEAMAMKKPILTNNFKPIDELFREKIGYLIERYEDFPKILAKLIKNKEEMTKLGINGRKTVEKHFDAVKMAKEYEKLYWSLR